MLVGIFAGLVERLPMLNGMVMAALIGKRFVLSVVVCLSSSWIDEPGSLDAAYKANPLLNLSYSVMHLSLMRTHTH